MLHVDAAGGRGIRGEGSYDKVFPFAHAQSFKGRGLKSNELCDTSLRRPPSSIEDLSLDAYDTIPMS